MRKQYLQYILLRFWDHFFPPRNIHLGGAIAYVANDFKRQRFRYRSCFKFGL